MSFTGNGITNCYSDEKDTPPVSRPPIHNLRQRRADALRKLNSKCSRATPHASAARIHPCSFDPVARFSAMTGATMAITSARRIWSRRRSRMEPQYRSRARAGSRAQPLPVRRRLDPLARGAEHRHPRRPHRCRRVATPARHLTIGERCRTRIGKPDVRIPTEPDVATVAVDGKPLHPVAAPAAGLHDEEERSAVTVTSRPQGRSLLGPESSCHRGRPRISPHEYATLGAGTGGPTTARPGPYTASGSQNYSAEPAFLGAPRTTSDPYSRSGSANT